MERSRGIVSVKYRFLRELHRTQLDKPLRISQLKHRLSSATFAHEWLFEAKLFRVSRTGADGNEYVTAFNVCSGLCTLRFWLRRRRLNSVLFWNRAGKSLHRTMIFRKPAEMLSTRRRCCDWMFLFFTQDQPATSRDKPRSSAPCTPF